MMSGESFGTNLGTLYHLGVTSCLFSNYYSLFSKSMELTRRMPEEVLADDKV